MQRALKIATPTDREIVIQRDFDAPCRLVWEAITTPDLIRRWIFFPPDWTMTRCEEDARVGGGFRWEWADPSGATIMVMHGVYREVTPPRAGSNSARVVRTETMEFGGCGGESLSTIELKERASDGSAVTTLTLSLLFSSKDDRDAALASGMEQGIAAGYDKLEEIITADKPVA